MTNRGDASTPEISQICCFSGCVIELQCSMKKAIAICVDVLDSRYELTKKLQFDISFFV